MGAGPRFAVTLADGLRANGVDRVFLSLSTGADVLDGPDPPVCDLSVGTYSGYAGFLGRWLLAPFLIARLVVRLRGLRPDLAVCGLPGPMDLMMLCALRLVGARVIVIVHDADAHPGDGHPFLMRLQRGLCRAADAVGALSAHVGRRLMEQGLAGPDGCRLIRMTLPPTRFQRAPDAPPPGTDGPLRLLFFGRLLPYKGVDLLAEALDVLGPRPGIAIRVVGSGPESSELDRLRAMAGVTVENRWVPEPEVGSVLGWAHALVLPYREASQSGVAAAGLAAGCAIVATDVGGLREQIGHLPHVMLCPPEPAAVAAAIDAMARDRPVGVVPIDADAAWRDMAASLLRQAAALGLTTGAAAGSRP